MTDCQGHSVLHHPDAKGHVEPLQQLIEAEGMELVLLGDEQSFISQTDMKLPLGC